MPWTKSSLLPAIIIYVIILQADCYFSFCSIDPGLKSSGQVYRGQKCQTAQLYLVRLCREQKREMAQLYPVRLSREQKHQKAQLYLVHLCRQKKGAGHQIERIGCPPAPESRVEIAVDTDSARSKMWI